MDIPLRCYKCNQVHEQNVNNFTIGNVIFCPHCHKSTVVRDNLNYHIRTLLKDSYDKWQANNRNLSPSASMNGSVDGETRQRSRCIRNPTSSAISDLSAEQLDAIGDQYDAARQTR